MSGDKPENVVRNIGIQALLGGFQGMGEGGPGFGEGFKNTFRSSTAGRNIPQGGTVNVSGEGPIPTIEGSTGSGGVAATFAVGTVNIVVKSVEVKFVINLLNTSAIN